MGNNRRGVAPNPEWVLMDRKGLSRLKIAELVGAAPATVGYHLGVARTLHPGVQAEHEAPTSVKLAHTTVRGRQRMQQLLDMVQTTGRYPSRTAPDASERALAARLQRRRSDACAGTLTAAVRDGLGVLPGWESVPRALVDEARWQDRLEALTAVCLGGTGRAIKRQSLVRNVGSASGCIPSATS